MTKMTGFRKVIVFLLILCQVAFAVNTRELPYGAGLNASTRKLFEGAFYKWSTPHTNQLIFVKYGNYSKTVDDFFSVNPTDVKEYNVPNGPEMKYGRVGKVEITIYKNSGGYGGLMKIFEEEKGTPTYVIHYIGNMELFLNNLRF